MKKTITAIVAAVMASVMSITSFAEVSVPDILPDNADSIIDAILNVFDVILGLIGEFAGLLFK